MAEQSDRHVVNQAQSVDEPSSIDVSGSSYTTNVDGGGEAKFDSGAKQHFPSDEPTQPRSDGAEGRHLAMDEDSIKNGLAGDQVHPSTSNHHVAAAVVDQGEHLVNGDGGSHDGSEDIEYQHSTGGDSNPGSDNEPSKREGVEQAQDALIRQERINAMKKPTSFKTISVTKNFLAKSGVGAAVTVKAPNDKTLISNPPVTAAPQGAKPRLVAKSGKDARLGSLRTGIGTNSGPDANKVWNRNRPAPPPTPKQFTDEELKQQYGIHLATRLGTDEGGKESKWADIDDDEDDWAPETVEWMDGTKSTIPPTETQSGMAAAGRMPISKEPADPLKEPTSTSPRPSSISSLGKTILRPGARSLTQTKPGLVLKSVPENPTQAEKPTASGSSKSPWAQLPPIDKVSPISFNPPAPPRQASPSSLPGPAVPEGAAPVTSPAREIAADDFNRSWRDGERSSRELFNSQSGRYEPVKAPRRPSRQDSGFRPPAVLQRPSQQGQAGFAEPSAAFQSNRGTSNPDGSSWSRRRDSSSMSERNASNRRVSEQGDETQTRAETHAAAMTSSPQQMKRLQVDSETPITGTPAPPTSALDLESPTEHQPLGHALPSLAPVPVPDAPPAPASGPQTYFARPSDRPAEPAAGAPVQDARAAQQQLMRERIELNRKRKQEEEAREEAARKARIRVKMEALAQTALAAPQADTSDPIPKTRDSVPSASETSGSSKTFDVKATNNEFVGPLTKNNVAATITASGVASPISVSDRIPSEASRSPPSSDPLTSSRPQFTSAKSPPVSVQRPTKSLSDSNVSATGPGEVHQLPGLGQVPPVGTQPWSTLPAAASPSIGWAGSNRSMHSGNVWGPPSNDKLLGNGAFEGEFQRITSKQRQSQPSTQLPMSNPLPQPSTSPGAPFDNVQAMPTTPQPFPPSQLESVSQGSQWYQSTPLLPPSYPQPTSTSHISEQAFIPPSIEHEQAAKRAWRDFPGLAARYDSDVLDARLSDGPRGEVQQDFQPTFRETFRQTTSSDVLGNRQVVAVSKTTHEGQTPGIDSVTNNPTQPIAPLHAQPVAQQPTAAHATINGRASRFFGPGVDRTQTIPTTLLPSAGLGPPDSASPPPPDSLDHPAFGGANHPLVHLPAPPPKVKLPPAPAPVPEPTPILVSATPSAQPSELVIVPTRIRTGPQPIVNQVAWQDRFNGLFNRGANKTTTPQPVKAPSPQPSPEPVQPALAVETSSKTAFDVSPAQDAATVSLPQGFESVKGATTFASLPDTHIESKPSEEELLDEREFGSSPTVYLPRTSHENPEVLRTMPPQKYGSKSAQIEMGREFVSSVFPLSFEELDIEQKVENGIRMFIRFLGRPVQTKILRDTTMVNNPGRTTKLQRKQKRNNIGRAANVAGSGSQLQENMTTRTEMAAGNKSPGLGPQPERRTSWGKPNKPWKGQQQGNSDVSAAHTAQPLPGSKTQEGTTELSARPPRPQSSRSSWAKPPKGTNGHGFNPTRV